MLHRFTGFVGLQMADQVPGDVGIVLKFRLFDDSFLHAAFAKMTHPCRVGRTNHLHRQQLRHRHQSYIGGQGGLQFPNPLGDLLR